MKNLKKGRLKMHCNQIEGRVTKINESEGEDYFNLRVRMAMNIRESVLCDLSMETSYENQGEG